MYHFITTLLLNQGVYCIIPITIISVLPIPVCKIIAGHQTISGSITSGVRSQLNFSRNSVLSKCGRVYSEQGGWPDMMVLTCN